MTAGGIHWASSGDIRCWSHVWFQFVEIHKFVELHTFYNGEVGGGTKEICMGGGRGDFLIGRAEGGFVVALFSCHAIPGVGSVEGGLRPPFDPPCSAAGCRRSIVVATSPLPAPGRTPVPVGAEDDAAPDADRSRRVEDAAPGDRDVVAPCRCFVWGVGSLVVFWHGEGAWG